MVYVCDVLYVHVCSFVVRGCAVSRRSIDVCNCDVYSVVNVYLDHFKLCVVCINSRRYVCCSECNVVSNECYERTKTRQPTSSGDVTTDTNCCANCVETSRPQQWGPDLLFGGGKPAMQTLWTAGAAPHKSG